MPFFITDDEADFILNALKFVAEHGWVFLPLYRYDSTTGEWTHRQHDISRDRKWLGNVDYSEGRMSWSYARMVTQMPAPDSFKVSYSICLTCEYLLVAI